MYDFIYSKIYKEFLILHLLQRCSGKKVMNYQALNLHINNLKITLRFQIGANYQAKSKSLDSEISLLPMVLKILYGVRADAFSLWSEFGLNIPKI